MVTDRPQQGQAGPEGASVRETNQQYYEGFWSEAAIAYLSQSAGTRWFNHLLGLLLKKIDPAEVQSVADIGCGVGIKTAVLAGHFPRASVTGFDFAAPAIEAASRAHRLDNISFSVEDITAPGHRQRYDLITAFDVLEHIEDWQGLVRELAAVNGRQMMFSFPVGRMRPYEEKIGHFRNFRRGEVESFMSSLGYRAVKVYYAGFPFYSPITRDLTNIFFKSYSAAPQAKMSRPARLMHDIWYFLFRYCSARQRGDNFLGLFERDEAAAD